MHLSERWNKIAPLVIAHRGASAYAPENTMASFRLAVSQGADAIELDAKLTRDNVVVVLHDDTLDRTTNGQGAIHLHNHDEIRELDAGRFFSKQFSNERIPTLSEVFQELGESVLINVELTNYRTPFDRLPNLVVNLIREHQLESNILLSSFNPLTLFRAHRLAPEIPLGLLLQPGTPAVFVWTARVLLRYDYLHPHMTLASRRLVSSMHDASKKVNVWTANNEGQIEKLIGMGVDGIISDNPDVALNVIKKGDYRVDDANSLEN
jgi:glycerophosphoryl diester phosphodiesterase